jgi:hypothetical protein
MHVDMRAVCVGDGATNDTSAWTTQMTTSVGLGHVHVFIAPNKTYAIDRWVHSTAGVTVRFYGGGTIKCRSSSDSLIKCANSTAKVILDGVKLDGSNIALTATTSALALCTAGKLVVRGGTEIYNAGVALSGTSCGISSNSGGQLDVEGVDIHDVNGYSIRATGTGRARLAGGTIKDCGNSAIYIDANAGAVSDGCTVDNWLIDTCRNDLGGTGQNGNGIHVFNVSNVAIGASNVIKNTAYSFIRIAGQFAGDISVAGGVGINSSETGVYVAELGARRVAISNFVSNGCDKHGMTATNLSQGLTNVSFNNCEVYSFGRSSATPCFGITCEFGQVLGCTVDGNNQPSATWGVATAPGAFTADWVSRLDGNFVAGCKYDVGVSYFMVGGTQRSIIGHNTHFRSDANYSSPIGAIGGSASDIGNGSAVTSGQAVDYHWDTNYFDVPDAEKPPTAEIGSRMKIAGVWKTITSVGGAWT